MVVVALLLVPLVALQFADQMAWGPFDFIVAGGLALCAILAYELLRRTTTNLAYHAGAGAAMAAAFFLVWINLAVGMIGEVGNHSNLLYGGVLAVGLVGAVLARFRAKGMARALFATALAQGLLAVIIQVRGWQSPMLLNWMFAFVWLGSAALFQHACDMDREPPRQA
ncbi:MAG TPA: hypothetical protein VGS03_07435 [Candidatus Polarisedimenticolia bacterium]|jgi:hypothetical protein|nr:hypothetical protein [Candidatus Polarisedimenticolia bacterium]